MQLCKSKRGCIKGMFTSVRSAADISKKEVRKGRMEDALALRGEEGRDKLRKAAGSCT